MDIQPPYSTFARTYAQGRAQVLWTSLVADLDTPVSAMLKLAKGLPNTFLLESVEGGAVRGRYSFIGRDPDLIWRCHGNAAEVRRPHESGGDAFNPCPVGNAEGALASLRAIVAASRIDLPAGLPPMSAGLFGYIGYDMVRLMERLPDGNPDTLGLPDGLFVRPLVICVFDTIADRLTIVTPVRPRTGSTVGLAYEEARERLATAIADFSRTVPRGRGPAEPPQPMPQPDSNITQPAYHAMVEKAKGYIFAGDIFQVVPSQRFRVPFDHPPFALYRALRRLNPSPFLFYLDFDGFAVVGSSPEILVRVRDGKVTIRPIAGTRRRGASREEDVALEAELLADPKERAEHLMLLDLGRNDVGRVAETGSVRVTEQMVIERYSHVMHIVSNVEGTLDAKYDVIDALIAGFPAGTVSGAPKVRAMEIIDELEPERRGIYGGCIGYIGASGELDTCIALRTAIVKDKMLYVQAGGGIVADSDAEAEYQETCNKAGALLRAAAQAAGYTD
ncbi:MAG: anthranilate synthase component I [Rhodospirillales bacterium]|nr:anthranilate synthase component I [Rhodospirillales bacterium]